MEFGWFGALASLANGVKTGNMYAFMIPYGCLGPSFSETAVCPWLAIWKFSEDRSSSFAVVLLHKQCFTLKLSLLI